MSSESVDGVYLRLAYEEATKSPDPSNQNGALLITRGGTLVKDCNRFPLGYPGNVHDRTEKLRTIGHSETNVIHKAARCGYSTDRAIMYCPWFACSECAKAIVFSGIKTVVGHKQRMDLTSDRWKANVDAALKYLEDCGVNLMFFDGPIGGPEIIVEGQKWQS